MLRILVATSVVGLSHRHEENEKELLRIGEHFGLRGKEVDVIIEKVSGEEAEKLVGKSLDRLKELTLTVIDGDFPRQVIANQNLKFSDFAMAASRNNSLRYDTRMHKAGKKMPGIRISGRLKDLPAGQALVRNDINVFNSSFASMGIIGVVLLVIGLSPNRIQRRKRSQNKA